MNITKIQKCRKIGKHFSQEITIPFSDLIIAALAIPKDQEVFTIDLYLITLCSHYRIF